jgi:hypothetical protein
MQERVTPKEEPGGGREEGGESMNAASRKLDMSTRLIITNVTWQDVE